MDRLINYYAINLSLNLASKHVKDGNTELALHHLNEIELLMDKLMEDMQGGEQIVATEIKGTTVRRNYGRDC